SMVRCFIDGERSDLVVLCFFFFQAEDGIRDWSVTGVQTCALPIYLLVHFARGIFGGMHKQVCGRDTGFEGAGSERRVSVRAAVRSEERRVGKEWRSRWSPCH